MGIIDLRRYEGRVGLLSFKDGHVVTARIVHVDSDDRNEIIYDVIDVVTPGRAEWASIPPGTTATTPLAEVSSFQQGGGAV
jgi:hypothetical protein